MTILLLLPTCSGIPDKQPEQNVVPAEKIPGTKLIANWPMFRFSLDRTGYNPTENSLSPPLELKWRFDAKSKI
jgi:hypothetical protein